VDSELWKEDSIGCLGKRQNIYYHIIQEENDFLKKSVQEIEKVFGFPNEKQVFEEGLMYYYYVEAGIQCAEWFNRKSDTADVEVLFIFFEKGQTTEVGGMKP
tara:strand:+ start:109 stop:414 length:306 start_codon:yes stop_codon:yes gene_type:complete